MSGAFLDRLGSERLQFTTLSALLASSEDDPVAVFQDLRFRAHRLKGAAAIFEFRDLAASAHALEKASADAAQARAENHDAGVWSALVKLVGMLGEIRGERAPASSVRADQQTGRPAQ